jgi:alpha-N-arabinofuranosidase
VVSSPDTHDTQNPEDTMRQSSRLKIAAGAADAEVIVFATTALGPIHDLLWGQFIELGGRCVNGGIYDPASPQARPDGTRGDVFAALAALHPTHIRYPGGCGTAYFDWQELVGPPQQRPAAKLFYGEGVHEQATAFGIPEAHVYCRELGAQLYLTVNAHTQSPVDAANLVEYLNGTTQTKWAALRRAHGHPEPFNVKLFGLGNEIYGGWQPGQKTAEEYVKWCREAIWQMKAVDPTITVVAVGLGRPGPEWDRIVLKGLIANVDMISVHNYFGRPVFRDCMAASRVFEEMIAWVGVAIDEAMDTHLARKTPPLMALDEWNMWYRATHGPVSDIEEIYNYGDALAVASLFHVMLRNTRRIGLSNISEAVNMAGGLFTDRNRMARQTIYHAQKLMRDSHSGRVVRAVTDGPVFAAKHERYFCGIVDVEKAKDENLPSLLHFDDIPAVDALVSVDDSRKKMRLSVVQKLENRPLKVKLDFRRIRPKGEKALVRELSGPSLKSENTLDRPDVVGILESTVKLRDTYLFPPASATVLEFAI